jgi:hypothetical protein
MKGVTETTKDGWTLLILPVEIIFSILLGPPPCDDKDKQQKR